MKTSAVQDKVRKLQIPTPDAYGRDSLLLLERFESLFGLWYTLVPSIWLPPQIP